MNHLTIPAPEARANPLAGALLESRQRWRDLVSLSADLAFETDAAGVLTFITPDPVLGWSANALIGQPASNLLAEEPANIGFNPFAPLAPIRRRRAWLRRPDGVAVCLSFAAAPLLDSQGGIVGARGVGQDVTEQDGYDAAVAAALRRGEVVDHILWRMRQEVLAPRMMQAALEALSTAMGAEGCMVVDAVDNTNILHQINAPPETVQQQVSALLEPGTEEPVQAVAACGRCVLICPSQTRFGEPAALALWRGVDRRTWDADDLTIASSATGIVRVILEHEAIQREMARQARTDPLTGLLNRRAFMDELARRIDRLDREALPGTLMFVDLDNFKDLNDTAGHDVGDEALCLGDTAITTLTHLVEDEAVRVREAIADVLKDMPTAPRALILRLAHDSAVAVFDPVIRLSPLLTEEDLLALTRAPGTQTALASIARRADLPESVCDRVAATADTAAITALLENHSAAIREATLDSLIARAAAPAMLDWHAPLVRRPRLSAQATRALSDIVATQLLDELAHRADLAPETTAELRRRLAVRLQPDAVPPRLEPRLEDAMAEAHLLASDDRLTEDTLFEALQRGEARRATALLAVAASVPVSVVERAATLRSAKGLVALVWKAEMSMRVGMPIQILLARAAPRNVLRATPNGGFPLALDEMRWQLDFLTRMAT